MTSGIRGDEFSTVLDEVRGMLAKVRAQPPGAAAEPVQAQAADGKVSVSIGPDGRVGAITVDPKMLRDGLEVICQSIAEAVNAGFDQLRTRATSAVSAIDTETLTAQLQEVQEQSVRQMAAMGTVLHDIVASLERGRS